jgi:hypothetical protein
LVSYYKRKIENISKWVQRRIFGPTKEKVIRTGGNYIFRSFTVESPRQILRG